MEQFYCSFEQLDSSLEAQEQLTSLQNIARRKKKSQVKESPNLSFKRLTNYIQFMQKSMITNLQCLKGQMIQMQKNFKQQKKKNSQKVIKLSKEESHPKTSLTQTKKQLMLSKQQEKVLVQIFTKMLNFKDQAYNIQKLIGLVVEQTKKEAHSHQQNNDEKINEKVASVEQKINKQNKPIAIQGTPQRIEKHLQKKKYFPPPSHPSIPNHQKQLMQTFNEHMFNFLRSKSQCEIQKKTEIEQQKASVKQEQIVIKKRDQYQQMILHARQQIDQLQNKANQEQDEQLSFTLSDTNNQNKENQPHIQIKNVNNSQVNITFQEELDELSSFYQRLQNSQNQQKDQLHHSSKPTCVLSPKKQNKNINEEKMEFIYISQPGKNYLKNSSQIKSELFSPRRTQKRGGGSLTGIESPWSILTLQCRASQP